MIRDNGGHGTVCVWGYQWAVDVVVPDDVDYASKLLKDAHDDEQ